MEIFGVEFLLTVSTFIFKIQLLFIFFFKIDSKHLKKIIILRF